MMTSTSMNSADWLVLGLYFLGMIGVGMWARTKVKTASDFFTAGGAMPWWLSGISHHMSGYSSAVFVGYAGIAYVSGFSIYIWWACTIAIALLVGYRVFPPRWSRLRQYTGMISPLEYLIVRYNLPAQQLLAWSGALLKVFDVGAKWTATAILLNVFAHVPVAEGVLLTGGVTLVYSVVGGLWADALTDFSQFGIQLVAGGAMLIAVLSRLGGISGLWTVWGKLPAQNHHAFAGPYTPWFALIFLMINTLSYNGGTWNLAQRFIAAPSGREAEKAALLSAALYLVWPLVLLFPMWAAPVLLPHLANPSDAYAVLAETLLPHGLLGLVIAGLFAHTMAMTSSDANAISAVVVRDILPALRRGHSRPGDKVQLRAGRICTFLFLGSSMVIATFADRFGGVLGLLILWFAALLGPIAIPMLLGMLWPFRRSGASAAIVSWIGGVLAFATARIVLMRHAGLMSADNSIAVNIGAPLLTSFVLYVTVGLLFPSRDSASEGMLERIQTDEPSSDVSPI